MNNETHPVKTYISEANQNRISETLTLNEPNKQSTASINDSSSVPQFEPQIQEQQPENHEPEALNAPLSPLPPTSAAADAEAVAGVTIGSTYGDEGEIHADEKSPDSNATE